MGRLSAGQIDELKRQQTPRLRSDIAIRSAPASRRARASQRLDAGQIEQLRQAFLNAFRF
jgi:hypothetical protein